MMMKGVKNLPEVPS